MAVCLALNKQASKTLCWAILATDVCVIYVFMCVSMSNLVQTDWISVSGMEIHNVCSLPRVWAWQASGVQHRSALDCSKCQALRRKEKRGSPTWFRDWWVAPC